MKSEAFATDWMRINGDVYAIDLASGKIDYKLQ